MGINSLPDTVAKFKYVEHLGIPGHSFEGINVLMNGDHTKNQKTLWL